MSELPLVVTARLHVTRHGGVTKVCPRHPTRRAATTSTQTRTEARFTVTLPDAQLWVDGKGKQAPPNGRGQNHHPHRRAPPPPASRPSPPGGLRPALTPAQPDQQQPADRRRRRRTRRRPTSPRPDSGPTARTNLARSHHNRLTAHHSTGMPFFAPRGCRSGRSPERRTRRRDTPSRALVSVAGAVERVACASRDPHRTAAPNDSTERQVYA